jgi:hypothetical protein
VENFRKEEELRLEVETLKAQVALSESAKDASGAKAAVLGSLGS